MEGNLIGTDAVAKYLGVHPRTIINLVERGELIGYKVGRHYRFKKSDIDVFLEKRRMSQRNKHHDQITGTDRA